MINRLFKTLLTFFVLVFLCEISASAKIVPSTVVDNQKPDLNPKNTLQVLHVENRQIAIPSDNPNAFEIRSLDFTKYTGLIVVTHPQCHFFKTFLVDIAHDVELRGKMVNSSIWISNSSKAYTNPAFKNWNKSIPDIPISIVYDTDQWPEINSWGSPTFYFFKDSKLQKKVVGWPKDSAKEKKKLLREGFELIEIERNSRLNPLRR